MDYDRSDWLSEEEKNDYTDWSVEIKHDEDGYKVVDTTEDTNGLPLR